MLGKKIALVPVTYGSSSGRGGPNHDHVFDLILLPPNNHNAISKIMQRLAQCGRGCAAHRSEKINSQKIEGQKNRILRYKNS